MSLPNDLSTPLRTIALGYTLCFIPRSGEYGAAAGHACLVALQELSFSGRCEFYAREDRTTGYYLLGLGVMNASGTMVPDEAWWKSLLAGVRRNCDANVDLHPTHSAGARVWALRDAFVQLGVVFYEDGRPGSFSAEPECAWFARGCEEFVSLHDRGGL